jgi:predicted nucleotidyltransferase
MWCTGDAASSSKLATIWFGLLWRKRSQLAALSEGRTRTVLADVDDANQAARSMHQVAQQVAAAYSAWPEVLAVVLSGSHATRLADAESDLDMYVYCDTAPALESRVAVAQGRASAFEVDNRFWETGDEWLEAETGLQVDVTFRTRAWIEERLARVLERFEPLLGYSTSIWHNVLVSEPLFDRSGWFETLQRWARQPYPEQLAEAIVRHNYAVLRGTLDAYPRQLGRATARRDATRSALAADALQYLRTLVVPGHSSSSGSTTQW